MRNQIHNLSENSIESNYDKQYEDSDVEVEPDVIEYRKNYQNNLLTTWNWTFSKCKLPFIELLYSLNQFSSAHLVLVCYLHLKNCPDATNRSCR